MTITKRVVLLLLCNTTLAMATTRYVDLTSSSPAPPYTTWETAATSIQDAVDVSDPGDTVLVANGHYYLSAEIAVDKNITIQTVNGPQSTTIDGQWLYRIFNLTSACTIEGFRIINGYSPGHGGGIYCSDAAPLIKNCVIEHCTAILDGGGVYNGTLEHCIIRHNTSNRSGGGAAWSVANGCIISGNEALKGGGGMWSGTANSCTIVYNTAHEAGTMAGGGGVSASGTTVGGIYSMKINNSIVWYNSDPNNINIKNTTSTYSCSPDVADGVMGNIILEPGFIDSEGGDYRLVPESPCIDSGFNAHAQTATDLDGNPRIVNGQADMGAYEFQTGETIINLPIRVILQHSSDLNTWTNTGKTVEWLIPASGSQGFYRARSEL